MSTAPAMKAKCGASTRSGGTCGLPAGHGTSHVGTGSCRRHGGNTESGIKSAAVAQARTVVPTLYGAGPDIEPTDALLSMVRMAAGHVAYFQSRIQEDGGKDGPLFDLLRASMKDTAQFSKMALDANVAERRVKLAERIGAMLSAAFEDGIRAVFDGLGRGLPAHEAQLEGVRVFETRLLVLEGTATEVDGDG
jgi:hypothetical protein